MTDLQVKSQPREHRRTPRSPPHRTGQFFLPTEAAEAQSEALRRAGRRPQKTNKGSGTRASFLERATQTGR